MFFLKLHRVVFDNEKSLYQLVTKMLAADHAKRTSGTNVVPCVCAICEFEMCLRNHEQCVKDFSISCRREDLKSEVGSEKLFC